MCGAKQKEKTSLLAWIGLVLLVLLGIGMCADNSLNEKSSPASSVKTQTSDQADGVSLQNWKYETIKDEMRGIESKFATVVSTNKVDFDFPYSGGSNLMITLRKKGNETDVMVAISKGNFLCGFSGCEAAFKFDNGDVQSITMSDPDSHAPDLIFVAYDKTKNKIIKQLKTSNKLVVEVPFFKEGKKQFIFDVSDLKWD
ncbi:hypothetical protein CDG60_12225 [Acinetobacter chinensis]|uniref:Uncharacterized protein n=2 Tax=Acinetobacter chinensis TaxID=2004650 RepID=A0A3B7M2C9_9GAMM|nr:hypothetical protein CDG60_12225 [Acinetobacter chinensis]